MTEILMSLSLAAVLSASAVGHILSLKDEAVHATLISTATSLQSAAHLDRLKWIANYKTHDTSPYQLIANRSVNTGLYDADCHTIWNKLLEHTIEVIKVDELSNELKRQKPSLHDITTINPHWQPEAGLASGQAVCRYQLIQQDTVQGTIIFNIASARTQVAIP